jgi:hypothetical protein
MRHRWLWCALALALASSPLRARACELSRSDREWIAEALEVWGGASQALGRPLETMPWSVLYDESCAVHLNPRTRRARVPLPPNSEETDRAPLRVTFGGRPVPVRSAAYTKRFALPSGLKIGSGALAFTALAKDGEPFFVMALPSVWKKDPRSMPDENVEEFAAGVLAHEITHTLHLRSIWSAVEDVARRNPMPKEIDDDYLQNAVFGEDADYVAAYEREIALYRRALEEADASTARELARQALAASDQRRARFFQGENAFFTEVEPIFLNMEGVASWAAYTVVGHGGDPMAFSGRFWSQQEGLFLFLLLDRFEPRWKTRVFESPPPSPFEMLRHAL